MRPARFQNLLAMAVANDGQFVATTYAEAGIKRSLWGIILTGVITVDVQIAARSALGDDYTQSEHIVTGTPHSGLTSPANPKNLTDVERYLAALIIDVAPQEFEAVRMYYMRDKPGAMRHGATFNFHDGSAIFMYVTASK